MILNHGAMKTENAVDYQDYYKDSGEHFSATHTRHRLQQSRYMMI